MPVCSIPVLPVPAAEFDERLIDRNNRPVPRYTSYPTLDRFSESFDYGDYLQAIAGLRTRGVMQPLSLHLRIPFCASSCHFCTRQRVIDRSQARAELYLEYLKKEITLQGQLFAGINRVSQLHLGGGTPSALDERQLAGLLDHVLRWFQLARRDEGVYSIEVDPRTVTPASVRGLRALGLNQVIFGVQDLDPAVLAAVNRPQDADAVLAAIAAAHDAGFDAVAVELQVGLPRQDAAGLRATLARLDTVRPDRIAILEYEHAPHIHRNQRRIDARELPDGTQRREMLALCLQWLQEAGYVHIGLEQFALPSDALARAQLQGRLQRNLLGYSSQAEMEMVACGLAAVGAVGATYSQNVKTLDAYYNRLDRDTLPIGRGLRLGMDEMLRRLIIQVLLCHFSLSMRAIEQAWPIGFAEYFARELEALRAMQDEGLVTLEGDWLNVSAKGRLSIRQVCAVFDRHYDGSKALAAGIY